NCVERRDSTVAPQALHLMNNRMVHELADHFARRVIQDAGNDSAKQIERVYRIALSRPPTAEERTIAMEALRRLTEQWPEDVAGVKALATVCHAVVNSAAFLYVD